MTEKSYSVFDATPCTLGEGPTFDPDTNTVWWFDILGKSLLERNLSNNRTDAHQLPVMGSALAVIDSERHLLACEDGLYIRTPADGGLTLLTPLEADNTITRSNDSRVHPCGAFWIGTMGKKAEVGAGAIYHYYRGEIRRIIPDITVSNAICFSANGETGYFSDTPTGTVMRVDLDAATGLPIAEPSVYIEASPDVRGLPDGAVVDADGLFWNARWGGSCILAFDAHGTCVETIDLPVSQITCPAFVGDTGMIVTSAQSGLNEAQLAGQSLAGQTFVLERDFNIRLEPKVVL